MSNNHADLQLVVPSPSGISIHVFNEYLMALAAKSALRSHCFVAALNLAQLGLTPSCRNRFVLRVLAVNLLYGLQGRL